MANRNAGLRYPIRFFTSKRFHRQTGLMRRIWRGQIMTGSIAPPKHSSALAATCKMNAPSIIHIPTSRQIKMAVFAIAHGPSDFYDINGAVFRDEIIDARGRPHGPVHHNFYPFAISSFEPGRPERSIPFAGNQIGKLDPVYLIHTQSPPQRLAARPVAPATKPPPARSGARAARRSE